MAAMYLMILSDEEADELQTHWGKYESVKAIYASKEVLFTTESNALFAGVETTLFLITTSTLN